VSENASVVVSAVLIQPSVCCALRATIAPIQVSRHHRMLVILRQRKSGETCEHDRCGEGAASS
jgi:hypothetical protein